jgi:predicted nucleic acid-binding Zn ribbon protein
MTWSRRGPRHVGFALGSLERDWAPETVLAEVQRIWVATVGEAIAAEARPVSERGGVVTVACSASVWAQELDLMSGTILERLNGGLKAGRVQKLRCLAQN